MKPFASRYLLVVAFSLFLAACSSAPVEQSTAPAQHDPWAELQQTIASNELATAEDQLTALQAQTPDEPRVEQFQRQLAEAYLLRSQIVLQKGDVNAAATALARARALMPQAPALTGGDAVALARKAELERAEAALKAAEAKPRARLIDPTAPSTVVALKTTDSRALRRQLDDIAADVLSYQCEVVFQVPRTDDAPWLKTLLEKRVRKLDSGFELKQRHEIQRSLPAQVVLVPHQG
ncbi:Lipoprotein [Pseudomonas reidholzensis]|uniref:Lipoprotein n=1 Tax=Pseudomonas reidholzensis TaxID=1785162 RepID=A0A383RN08_9PSED|nr:PA5502 family lipoprotein [Pseudomonas reidholzensis]SYX87841.1 Lipoprotein [Pseudomonas reidholzensis]